MSTINENRQCKHCHEVYYIDDGHICDSPPATPRAKESRVRDELANSFAKNWSKPSPETAELDALSHAYSTGFSAALNYSPTVLKLVEACRIGVRTTKDLAAREIAIQCALNAYEEEIYS